MISAIDHNGPVPILETDRLKLRAHCVADFEPIAQHWESPRTRWTGGPLERKEAWKAFSMDCAQWHLLGYGMWIAEEKTSGKTAGWIGFYEPDHYDETEIGWVLLEEFEGIGLAEEAVRATRSHGESHFGITKACSFIATKNQRSIALAERVGASLEEKRDRGNGPFFVYRHPAPEALQ